jgi:hypothetical protein
MTMSVLPGNTVAEEPGRVMLLAFARARFPTMIAVMKWGDEVIDKHRKNQSGGD